MKSDELRKLEILFKLKPQKDFELDPKFEKMERLKNDIGALTEAVSNMSILKEYGIIIPNDELIFKDLIADNTTAEVNRQQNADDVSV